MVGSGPRCSLSATAPSSRDGERGSERTPLCGARARVRVRLQVRALLDKNFGYAQGASRADIDGAAAYGNYKDIELERRSPPTIK